MPLFTATKRNSAFSSAQWSRRESYLGIDVGTSMLKLVRAGRVGKEWAIQSYHVLPLPNWSADHKTTELPETLQFALKGYAKEFQSLGKGVAACTFPLNSPEFRVFDLPMGSDSELKEMVNQELELDTANEDVLMSDFWAMESSPAGEDAADSHVGVLTLSRNLVHEFAQLLFNWGIECEIVDGLPFAMARAATLPANISEDDVTMVIDWGYHSATLIVAQGGHPLYCRVLSSCGYRKLLERICGELIIDEAAARHLLSTVGFPRVNQEASALNQSLATWLTEPLQHLGREITRTQHFLRGQRPELSPERICLMGAGATIPNIAELFSAVFEIPCDVWKLKTTWTHPSTDVIPLLGPATALATLGGAT